MCAVVGAAALTLRLVHTRALAGHPVFDVLLGDSRGYVEWAAQIARGDWVGGEAFYQAPLYPYFLALCFSSFGESIDAVRIVQAMAGSAACVLAAIAARALFDWRAGAAAGLLLAIYPAAIFFDGHIQKASLDLLLMAAVVAAAAKYQAHRGTGWLVVLGVSLGLFTLNRENARALAPVLLLWLLIWNRDLPFARQARAISLLVLAVVLPIAPVAVRNYAVSGEVLISTSQLGSNFYIGNHAGARGAYEPLVADRGSVEFERDDAMRLASEASGRWLTPGEVSSYWLERSFAEIRQDPAAWLRLLGRKTLLAINTVEATDTESVAFHADHAPVLRLLMPFTFGVLLPLAVLGVVLTAADRRRLALFYAIALVYLASVVLFFVLARYRYPVVLPLMLFAGAGLTRLAGAWRRRRRILLAGAACAVATAAVVNVPMHVTTDESYANFGAELLRRDRPREAVPLLQRAVARLPDAADLHRDLAVAYVQLGEHPAAAREYRAFARLDGTAETARKVVEVLVQMASHDMTQGRAADAMLVLREAAELARASGQDGNAAEIERTLRQLEPR